MSNSVADIQVLLLRMPIIHHWINMEQLKTLWKLSNSSVNALSQNIQDTKSRLENLAWRLWHRHQQKAIAAATCSAPPKLVEYPTNNKFYMDVEELTEDEDEEDDESDSWDMEEEQEQDLLFEKRGDNNVYHISSQQPVSLLTQMLQQQNNNNKQPQQPQQPQPLLRRCQSKYRSLDEWFATSS